MKARHVTKITGLMLAILMLLILMAGCGSGQNTPTTSTSAASQNTATTAGSIEPAQKGPGWKNDTSLITFDYYINEPWYNQKWNTMVANYITEKTGVSLNFIIPTGNGDDKLNTMIASNTLPDLVCTSMWGDGSKKVEASKQVHTITELANKYEPYLWEVTPKSVVNWYTRDDGLMYGYPNFVYAPEQRTNDIKEASNTTFLVRKDIYEAIGKPDMTTPEGFLAALQAAKEKFPTIEGKPLIPIGVPGFVESGGTFVLNNFLQDLLAIPRITEEGKLVDRRTHPEYLRWMKTLRKANELGLFSKENFIDQRPQNEEKILQGRYFALLYQWVDLTDYNMQRYNKDPNSVYIAIDGPMNSNKDTPTLAGGGLNGWELNYITKNCKNSERAIKFFAYWASEEGQRDFYMGKEGELWDMVDGKPTFKPEVSALFDSDPNAFFEKYGARDNYWMLYNPLIVSKWEPEIKEPMKQNREWTYGKTIDTSIFGDLNPPADSEEGIIDKKIEDKWGEIQPKLILAKSDEEFDRLMEEFIKARESYGYEKLVKWQEALIQKNKKKAGMTN